MVRSVLVIGGTEFFGKHAVELFLDDGWRVTVLSRGRRRPGWWDRVEHIACDRTDREAFSAALRGRSFDVVFDNVAFDAPDVSSALEVFRQTVGHYVLTSSGAVYAERSGDRVFAHASEDEPMVDARADNHPYVAGKRRAERALVDHAGGLPYTVIRPTVVQGPEDPTRRPWFWIQRILDGGPLLVGDPRPEPAWNHAYSEDVARMVVRVAGNPVAFGKTYNAAGGEVITLVDYLWALGEALGRRPTLVRAAPGAWKEALPDYAPPFGRRFVMDIARARADLGYEPTPAGVWIAATARWFADAYRGEDSHGYGRRQTEIAFAQSFVTTERP
ncbi:MAG: NAD-dependent epimerase/dehydratase family protein [Armatimonadota bacterium]|nr:NAD-dependent epimerase/dehydratase family protein [Armatimonadota bacterium]MDR5696355.1 NAD-dependent epimerase/dehydratase family protein [Armatimonadota bacterium]